MYTPYIYINEVFCQGKRGAQGKPGLPPNVLMFCNVQLKNHFSKAPGPEFPLKRIAGFPLFIFLDSLYVFFDPEF